MKKRIPRIVEPDAVNEAGEPIDVLANLKAKKELAKAVVPGMMDLIEDLQERMLLIGEKDDEKIEEMKEQMRAIAEAYGIDPEGGEDE